MALDRREVLRRLGSRRFRFVCPTCRQYVPELYRAAVWDDGVEGGHRPVHVCGECLPRLEQRNREYVQRRARDQVQLEVANLEHQEASRRSSSADYLAACERMRREGW
jgi:hypothetical protein